MDEAWERAVEAALEGQAVDSSSPPRALTLDGAVKCLQGRLPPPRLLERYQSLEHLSIASVGVSSLATFPRLRNLRRLILSDNRIAGGLEFLVEAGLDSLRDLDLSNNRIQFLEDLAPLARLRLVSLDLYECPVTRVGDYRTKVFAMIRSLKYLDKMDADENERPETDEEDDDEEEEEDEEEDPGSGEIDGEDRTGKVTNGVVGATIADGIVGVDEDDESDADEEELETVRTEANGSDRGFHHHHLSNGFRVAAVGEEDEEEVDEDVEYDDVDGDDADEDLAEEIDEDDGEDEGVVEVHDIAESDEDGDEMEEEEEVEVQNGDEVDGDGDEDEDDVEDEEEDGEPGSTARMTSTDGEIDGHDQGEEDENGEIGEENEERVEEELNFEEENEGEDEEEDLDGDYLLQQHVDQVEVDAGGSDFDACNGEDEDGVDDDDNADADDRRNNGPSSSLQPSKRKRGGEEDVNEDDCVEDSRSSKHR